MRKHFIPAVLLTGAMLLSFTSCKTQIIINEETEGAEATSVIDDVIPVVTEATTEETTAETTTEEQTQPPETEVIVTEVDLSITLPEANGKMVVDTDSANKFTSAIADKKHVSPDLLAAVYSVPESDQNYVFEFKSDKFTADNLRRVYLLDKNCKITGVAADKASEREDMTKAENWFCMNVLIKGVIFPEIKEQLEQ